MSPRFHRHFLIAAVTLAIAPGALIVAASVVLDSTVMTIFWPWSGIPWFLGAVLGLLAFESAKAVTGLRFRVAAKAAGIACATQFLAYVIVVVVTLAGFASGD